MHRSKAAVAAALLTVLALLPLAVAPVAAGDSKDKAKAEHERIVKYWTAERIAERQAARLRPDGRRQVRAARPGHRTPPGGGVVKGASWTGGGPVVQRTGKVLFTMDGGNWVCSASAITDSRSSHSLVLTAGHCAYDEVNERSRRTGPTSPRSIPRRRSPAPSRPSAAGPPLASSSTTATRPRAASTPRPPSTTSRSRSSGRAARRNTQLDALGTYGIAYPAISTGGSVHSFGYPAAGKYKGKDLTYCAGPTFNDPNNGNLTWGIACNMTGGSSGGPWLGGFTNSAGTATSLNSYGYSGLSNMYGPKFNSNTQAVFNRANTTTGNSIVN